jgi:hypothetical protein
LGALRLGLLRLGLLGVLLLGLLRLLLLRCGRPRAWLWFTLLLFRLGRFFALLLALRVGREHRPEKQNQGGGTHSSKELHRNRLH